MNETFHWRPHQVPSDPTVRAAAESDVSLAMSAPFATLSSLWRALRRRRRVWASAAVAGVAAAIVLSVAFPPDHTATTTLLLQHSGQGDPTRAMASSAELLRTRTVAQAAIDLKGLRLSAQRLVSELRVTVLTTDILQLTVAGATEAEAVRRAGAVAEAFLTFRRQEYERQSRVEVDALRERAADVSGQLTRVNDAIRTFESRPDAKSESGLRDYGDLLSQKALLSGQIDQLQRRIDAATVAPASSVAKSRILDPPRADERSLLRSSAINMASGLVGGLAVAAGWIVLQELVSDRVRSSTSVAAALQAPVAITAGRLRTSRRRQRKRFRTRASDLPRDVVRVVGTWRYVLSRARTVKGTLAVLSVDADREAALFVACTAAELVREGQSVVVADLSPQSVLAGVFAVEPQGTSTVQVPGAASTLRVSFLWAAGSSAIDSGTVPRHNPSVSDADRVLVLFTPAALMEPIPLPLEWPTTAAAVVKAGAANAATLRSTAQMLEEVGLELDHAVVVAADADDHGSGLHPEARSGGVVPVAGQPRTVSSGDPT